MSTSKEEADEFPNVRVWDAVGNAGVGMSVFVGRTVILEMTLASAYFDADAIRAEVARLQAIADRIAPRRPALAVTTGGEAPEWKRRKPLALAVVR